MTATATPTKAKMKTAAPDVEGILGTIETLEHELPPSERELNAKRSYLEGQLRWAQGQSKGGGFSDGPTTKAEVAKAKAAIPGIQEQLDSLPTFSPAARRDAAIEFMAALPQLQETATTIGERWGILAEFGLKGALSSTEFAEKERLEGLRARISTLISKGNSISGELGDLLPGTLKLERTVLQKLEQAMAAVPDDSPVVGDTVARIRQWAAAELTKIQQAVATETWGNLEAFKVTPL